MKKLDNYYESIKLSCTAEELTKRVISKSEMPKKKISYKFIGVAAAMAAVMMLGVTATAAGLGYFDIFSEMFGEKAEALTHNILEEAEIIRNDTEKMDFKLLAAAADRHRVMAVVDVIAKNGFKLGENHIGDARADIWWEMRTEPDSSGAGNIVLVEGNENNARIIYSMNCDDDITGREVTLTLGEYQVPEMRYCETDKQWQIEFIAYGESIEYEIDDVKISVSPISVWFESEDESVGGGLVPITIITEDDSIVIANGSSGRQTYADGSYVEHCIYSINEPIAPESVIAIEVQGRRFDLK